MVLIAEVLAFTALWVLTSSSDPLQHGGDECCTIDAGF
jgi:hypothetical protein